MKQPGKNGGWGFDNSIREAHGVRYRWSFLAKSHVTLSNSKDGYDYSCVFCAAKGRGTVVVRREGNFLKHVAGHQGEAPDRFKMGFFHYIVGRRALEQEIFDINLPAPFAAEQDTDSRETDSPGLGITMDEERISESIDADERTNEDDGETIMHKDHDRFPARQPMTPPNSDLYSADNDESMNRPERDIHPALRSPAIPTNPFSVASSNHINRISVPDPWRASYVTMRHDSIVSIPSSTHPLLPDQERD